MTDQDEKIFSEISNAVQGFDGTFKLTLSTNLVSTETATDPLPKNVEKSSETNQSKDVAIQTDENTILQMAPVDDKKLAEWLKRILPFVEEELSSGVTNVFDFDSDEITDIKILKYKTIESKNKYSYGTGTWLSIGTQNTPILAITSYPNHSSWCDHTDSVVSIFVPKKNEIGFVDFCEQKVINVKSCVTSLVTNPFNKNVFSGGTISGDVYIWEYQSSDDNSISELFCESSQQGSVVGMIWTKNGLLTCHQDGFIIFWKIGKSITKDKIFKILPRSQKEENIFLSSITSISGNEFVVGCENGNVMLCSSSQLIPVRNSKNCFDPVVSELESHKFAVTSLISTNFKDKKLVISCDLSGEIYFHDVTGAMSKEGPSLIIKMPLPFKNRIVCTNDVGYILSPGIDGSLNCFRIGNGSSSLVEGNLKGKGDSIAISGNGYAFCLDDFCCKLILFNCRNWIVSGSYEGSFQIYKVDV